MPSAVFDVAYPARAASPPLSNVAGCDALEGFAWTMLPRHGRRPLGFHGRLLVHVSCRQPELPVWSEVTLHEAADGALVAAVRHVLRGAEDTAGALDARCYAESSQDSAELLELLLAHDPLADLPVEVLLDAFGEAGVAAAPLRAASLRLAWRTVLAAALGLPAPAAEAAFPDSLNL